MSVGLERDDASRLEACLASGGVAVFPSDTVYGVCCDPENEAAARRMYALKGRSMRRASAEVIGALRPARSRHLICDSSTASCNRGQRRNKALSAQAPSMRAS